MELNGKIKKTKELRISFSDDNFDLGNQLMINNEPVRVVKKAKLLGLTFSDQLKWNDHINDICSKASKSLYFFKNSATSRYRGCGFGKSLLLLHLANSRICLSYMAL